MKDEKRKKRKMCRGVIFSSCEKGKKSGNTIIQEDWDDHETRSYEDDKDAVSRPHCLALTSRPHLLAYT
eukprot:14373947-Ditylum_brightwellii.AAC.1